MSEIAIRAENIVKRYGQKRALDDFTIHLPQERVVGVLGSNGAGKSTFFRMIAGLIQPDHGTIDVLGRTPGWQTNRDIAYLPDRARWYEGHTVMLALDWAEHLLPGFERQRAESLISFMGLDPEMKVHGMSRGQEARLMLTICMARSVPLLLLDEPFSGIDLLSRERIIEAIIDNLSDNRQTVLISTHEIHESESLFDHVVFMDNGQVLLHGDVEMLRAEQGSMESIYRTLYR
ncbi:ABC transporter ATP-binding protein [Paenibacillus profundus]|uniref:ABC transporter ATP-binding protein n=1 Tax=Paenibacillus profundus TaxID=1173085 RepID=A0ABS8YF67_9BACL|nr:ABC transporter ATP-binding protein [Paenibacillus profundus]MCE5168981.1 ABC transporter ATP-binding protein [Paenibacillus profundus]